MTRIERISEIIEAVRSFRFCGPSDDLDEQTAVTAGYRSLLVELQRLAAPFLSEHKRHPLVSIDVEINNMFSVYEADAELKASLYDIEEALIQHEKSGFNSLVTTDWFVNSQVIERLRSVDQTRFKTVFLVRLCEEINSCFSHGNIVCTALVMRTVLNHIPPVFGRNSFKEVVESGPRSTKSIFRHLEDGLRKIADSLGHGTISSTPLYPSASQVEPYKPQFEVLLNTVYQRIQDSR